MRGHAILFSQRIQCLHVRYRKGACINWKRPFTSSRGSWCGDNSPPCTTRLLVKYFVPLAHPVLHRGYIHGAGVAVT